MDAFVDLNAVKHADVAALLEIGFESTAIISAILSGEYFGGTKKEQKEQAIDLQMEIDDYRRMLEQIVDKYTISAGDSLLEH